MTPADRRTLTDALEHLVAAQGMLRTVADSVDRQPVALAVGILAASTEDDGNRLADLLARIDREA